MKQRRGPIKLDLDISHAAFVQGDQSALRARSPESIVTVMDFALPLEEHEFREGRYATTMGSASIEVLLQQVASEADDLVAKVGKGMTFGGSERTPPLPLQAATDNRGRYPWYFARVVFPYRLAGWLDGGGQAIGPAQMVLGPPADSDKLQGLIAVNQVLRSHEYGISVGTITTEQVTAFTQRYFLHPERTLVAVRLGALDAVTAYRDALVEHLLPDIGVSQLGALAANIRGRVQEITDERALVVAVRTALGETLKHYVENRRWIEALWDGRRTLQVNGQSIAVPAQPKPEVKIQPTLHVLLDLLLKPLGIQIVRETSEGVGSLDFRCLFTSRDGLGISTGIEFKLAHHGELRRGVRSQLPAYLKAIGCSAGTFLVIWFKDAAGRFYNQPSNRSRDEMCSWLANEATEASATHQLDIQAILIDASIKPSASLAPSDAS